MQVKLAKTAGFCMGVRRAMTRVLEAAGRPGGRLVTFGPLIHNSQVTQLLEEKGVSIVEAPEDLQPGDRVAIRAHGIPPLTRAAIGRRGVTLCDATCPHVAKAQGIVKRAAAEGREVLIVGDLGHAEVVGLLGFAGGRGHVVERTEDIERLPVLGRVGVVAQTTQSEEHYRAMVDCIRARFPESEVHDTICGSTSDRQSETAILAREVDVMVVVGGRHSANTVRLAEVARAAGRPAVHVESPDELRETDFAAWRLAGVTAGASTPNWVIEEVVEKLESFQGARAGIATRAFARASDLLIRGNLLVALGAGGLAWASTQMLDHHFRTLYFVIAFAYVASMLNLNTLAELRGLEVMDRGRVLFFRRHRLLLSVLSPLLALSSLGLSALLGLGPFLVVSISAALGVLYTAPLVPRGSGFKYRRLKDLPGSRNIFFSLAVATVAVLLPALDSQPWSATLLVPLFFAGTLAFARSVVLDLKDLESDVFAGRETIPVLVGEAGTKRLLAVLLVLASLGLAVGWAFDWIGSAALWHLAGVGVFCGVLFLQHARLRFLGLPFHAAIDGALAFIGLLALAVELSRRGG